MAQLKDLIVNGASRFIGDLFASKILTNKINVPTGAGGTTYGPGDNGQILKSNGSTVYWGDDNNENTHYQTHLYVNPIAATSNAASDTNGNTYIRLYDDSDSRESIKLIGSGATVIKNDANGVITVNTPIINDLTTGGTTDTLSAELGKLLANGSAKDDNAIASLSVDGKTITYTKRNNTTGTITTQDTTYADATTGTHGLMSTADKIKLNGIATGANNYVLPTASESTLGGVKVDGNTITIDADGVISSLSMGGSSEDCLPLAGGIMTGTINSLNIVPKTNNLYTLGSSISAFKDIYIDDTELMNTYTSLGLV